jgi:beta-galactosidase
MAWHAVGHGADAVLYWQWRSSLNGQEQYHGTLVDPSGQPRPFYTEAKQLARDFASTTTLMADSRHEADVAMLNCYDSRWSIQWQPHHKDFDYVAHLLHYYRPLAAENIPVDIISADETLDGYKLVIAPALLALSERRSAQLKDFVGNGGHLVLTLRSGMKDEYNLFAHRQPGALKISGVEVDEYYALLTPVPVVVMDGGHIRIWAEQLRICDSEDAGVVTYGEQWRLDGHPAITRHAFGKGQVTFIGAYLDEESQKTLLQEITREASVSAVMRTPEGVEACRRVDRVNGEVIILINHTRSDQRVHLPWPAKEHLRDQVVSDALTLGPYDVAILTHNS